MQTRMEERPSLKDVITNYCCHYVENSLSQTILEKIDWVIHYHGKEGGELFLKWLKSQPLNSWLDHGENILKANQLLNFLSERRSVFKAAIEAKILPGFQILMQMVSHNGSEVDWLFRLNDQHVISLIKMKVLPIKDILQWSDKWQVGKFFYKNVVSCFPAGQYHSPDFLNPANQDVAKSRLLNELLDQWTVTALRDGLILLDKIKKLVRLDMGETADILGALNENPHNALKGIGINFILNKELSFDLLFELASQNDMKSVRDLLQALNNKNWNFDDRSLTPNRMIQAALNYDGDLSDFVSRINLRSKAEAKEMLKVELDYPVLRM